MMFHQLSFAYVEHDLQFPGKHSQVLKKPVARNISYLTVISLPSPVSLESILSAAGNGNGKG